MLASSSERTKAGRAAGQPQVPTARSHRLDEPLDHLIPSRSQLRTTFCLAKKELLVEGAQDLEAFQKGLDKNIDRELGPHVGRIVHTPKIVVEDKNRAWLQQVSDQHHGAEGTARQVTAIDVDEVVGVVLELTEDVL